MIAGKPFDFIIEHVNKLSSGLERKKTKSELIRGRKVWIGFCIMMAWDLMISVSIDIILESFGVFKEVIVIDDTGKKRSKEAKYIQYIHYYKDKEEIGILITEMFVLAYQTMIYYVLYNYLIFRKSKLILF